MSIEQSVSILNAFPMPVVLIGDDERIRGANPLAQNMFHGELAGMHYISALRQPALVAAVAAVRDDGTAKTVQFIMRGDPADTVYRVSVVPADDGILLTFEDQTEAQAASQMRRDFVANVSHELRTPLTALLGFIETLTSAARDDPPARDRFLGIMAHEASRMTRLVDDLMSLSRVEEDERVRPRENVNLGKMLGSVIKGLEPQAQNAGVQVVLDQSDQDETVPGDTGQLVQVFTNLIENALKYGASGGRVRVSMMPRAYHRRLRTEVIQISVADKGDGIAEHHIARLTERFYRVDTHRSRQVGGTGLGMAIVKHIVNRHRGRLLVESTVGEGTTVSVFLPTEHTR